MENNRDKEMPLGLIPKAEAEPAPAAEEKGEAKFFDNNFDVVPFFARTATVELTDEQKAILFKAVDVESIEIRPDGLIYAPWMEYSIRLREAFGLQWTLLPQGMPKVKGDSIFWGFWLIIKGSLCGYAIGEQEYIPRNRTMTFSDACEGAKSNALMRLCKGIGISLELWKPSFIREWKAKNAETYWDEKRHKTTWRKKGARREWREAESEKQEGGAPLQMPPPPWDDTTPELVGGEWTEDPGYNLSTPPWDDIAPERAERKDEKAQGKRNLGVSDKQRKAIYAMLAKLSITDKGEKLRTVSSILGKDIDEIEDLSMSDASTVIGKLNELIKKQMKIFHFN